jgi:putative aldouronate transport system permease protein
MSQSNQVRLRNQTRKQFKRQLPLHLFVWAGILFLVLFSIIPMSGVIIAFKDYNIKAGFKGMFTAPWTANSGFKHFITFVTNRKFSVLVRNTVIISSLKLLFAFPFAILFAIMVTEVRSNAYKRIVQTASYLPHFVSWIVVAGIVYAMFSTNIGVINELLLKLGWIKEPIPLLLEAKYYYLLATASEIWKETGWSAIIYLAAIAGIDPALYESAQVDEAGRLRRIWHITLPGIQGTVAILLILSVGSLFSGSFDQAMMLGNDMNRSRSEILDVFIYQTGLSKQRYSYAAAVGLFQSVISLILVILANAGSKKISGSSLF